MSQSNPAPPSRAKVWIGAMRPRTLPLALAGSGMGTFLAAAHGRFDGPVAFLCALTTVFLQILSNLANDYGDTIHGADSADRRGPQRAVQMGLILRRDMQRALVACALLCAVSGTALVYAAFGLQQVFLFGGFIALGAAAIWAAVAYTATDRPYGYVGLGDLFVLIFFGWVGTMGTYFVQAQTLPADIFWPATAVGLLSVAVLNVNNTRDIESDEKAGKRSLPVRMGLAWARRYHWFLLGGALVSAVIYTLLNYQSGWQWLFLVSVPLLARTGMAVSNRPPHELDPLLKQTALFTLLFVLTFGGGLLLN